MPQRDVADGFIIQIGVSDTGRFIAISNVSPFFCLFAATEEGGIKKATKAVLAYENLGVRYGRKECRHEYDKNRIYLR